MRIRVLVGLGVLLAVLFGAVLRLSAITAGDVMDRMGEQERQAYIWGLVDAFIYLEQVPTRGPTPRSTCIRNWYYGTDGPGSRQVTAFFDAHREQTPASLVTILIERACPR